MSDNGSRAGGDVSGSCPTRAPSATSLPQGAFRHPVSVRFGEVDQQGVVFNAHYLAYIDDTLENWLRPIRELGSQLGWDMMLRKCTIEWQGSVGSGDQLSIDVAVAHWGRTSWDLGYVGACEGRLVFSARVAYVSVDLHTHAPVETPREIREFMGEAIDLVAARTAAQ